MILSMNIETNPAKIARMQNVADRIGGTDTGADVLAGLYAKGRLRDIEENPNTWVSKSRPSEGRIWWGTGDMGPQSLHDMHYGQVDENFARTHRLLHEMGHLAIIQPNGSVVGEAYDLYETLDNIRTRNVRNLGMSAIAAHATYSRNMKPHEDAADLFGMLTQNENRYRAFMQFVQNDSPGIVKLKANHGIATISNHDAQLLDHRLRTVHHQASQYPTPATHN